MNYWQIAAGSEGRDYSEDFLRFGMAFVGGDKQIEMMLKVNVGDCVILKRGTRSIVAAGLVVARGGKHSGRGDKEWLSDYDGWDLNAYCFVVWRQPPAPISTTGPTRGTILRMWNAAGIQLADQIVANFPPRTVFDSEPAPTKRVGDEEIEDHLIASGFRVGAAEDLTQTFRRIRRLALYYYRNCDWSVIREHETRTFLVIPLLQALGWTEQQIKIEQPVPGGRADVALFEGPYTGRSGNSVPCVSLIETKGFSQGLFYAPEQAHAYATHFPKCKVVFVSNGYCYKAYTRQADDSFALKPTAYLNILNPRDRYPLDPSVEGCLHALGLLLHWV